MSTASSYWHESCGGPRVQRAPLPGDRDVDVAVVGAGYTGLWTAYYLVRRDPGIRVAVVEREHVGYGASGRNGGWCSAIYPATLRKVAASADRAGAVAMQQAMNDTVDEVLRVVDAEHIDCDCAKGGYVSVARNRAQLKRAEHEVAAWRSWGFGDDHMRLLGRAEVAARVGMADALGGTYTPHCAALHPAKLVRGLADVVERAGVTIYEQTAATSLAPGEVRTANGSVRAPVVIRATEGYTAGLPGLRRALVPMYSLMVATEPLPDSFWATAGLRDRETFSDKRHLRIYGQRTADGRIAFGGRGAPYHYGSRIRPGFDHDQRVHAMLRQILRELFPGLADATFTHAWGGALGIPRDWYPAVSYDPRTGMGAAGGYVGDGVATANLAGRTLADLVRSSASPLTALPWVRPGSPRWEPEPLRWIGVNAGTCVFALADRVEAASGRPSGLARGFWRALGH